MKELIKIGRCFYGIGVVALGIHQIIIKKFRSEILSPFPAWAHENVIFPILTGIALIFAGIIISGVFKIKFIDTKKVCLYLGFCFLAATITSHLPYIIMLSADKTPLCEVSRLRSDTDKQNRFEKTLERVQSRETSSSSVFFIQKQKNTL